MKKQVIKTIVASLILCGLSVAQDMNSCPMHKEHMVAQHQADVQKDVQKDVRKHGDQAMGFPQDKTTHHFRLSSEGGAIEVTANAPQDSANVEAIRSHLAHIVTMFSSGDFSIPMFIHGQTPPGVPVLKEKRAEISYTVEQLPTGARVRIRTTNPEALKAIHDFLSFQIDDHHTDDTLEVSH